jgi:hypothetical protein
MKTRLVLTALLATATALTGAMAAPQPGDSAPNFSLTSLGGKKVSLADYKGKYIVLEWNNPGCPYVQAQYNTGAMPKVQKEETSKGVVWLTINSSAPGNQGGEPSGDINKFLADHHATPTAYLQDPDGKVGHLYGAKTTPDMYVISPDGKLIYDGAIDSLNPPDPGSIPGQTNYVKAALDQARAGKTVGVQTTRPYGCSVKYANGSF